MEADSGLSLVAAGLASVCAESVLYGIFLVLTATTIYLFMRKPNRGFRTCFSSLCQNPLLLATVCMFVAVTAHWVITVLRSFKAFVSCDNLACASQFYADMSSPSRVALLALSEGCAIIGDVILIYRLWVVWNHNWRVMVVPALCVGGTLVCCIASLYHSQDETSRQSAAKATAYTTAVAAFVVSTNVYGSAMISWRLWRTHRKVKVRPYGGRSWIRILSVFVQSASVVCLLGVLYFTTYLAHSNVKLIVIDAEPPAVGIAFMLINVLIAIGWTDQPEETASEFVRRIPRLVEPDSWEVEASGAEA